MMSKGMLVLAAGVWIAGCAAGAAPTPASRRDRSSLGVNAPDVAEPGFQAYRRLGTLDTIAAGKKHTFTVRVREKAPGWALLLDPFPFEKRKSLTEAELRTWTKAGVNTTVHVELANRSKTIIDLAESPPPFSSDSVKPGETLEVQLKDFSHQMVIRKLRGTDPGPEWIEFDVTLSFEDDVDWSGGIHFGVVYVAVMHEHPEWFHISTRQRSWKGKKPRRSETSKRERR